MSVEVKVPSLPESIAEATVIAWHKKPGDPVKMGENLVDLETDKVVLEVPAPQDGVIESIARSDGDVVQAGDLLLMLGTAASAGKSSAPAKAQESVTAAKPAGSRSDVLSPAVRRMVEEHGLDPNKISGSGRDGRVTKEDVLVFMKRKDEKPEPVKPAAPAKVAAPAAPPAVSKAPATSTSTDVIGERAERRVPMTRLRTRIAERLVESQQNAAILTTFNEVNMKPLMDMRNRHKDAFLKEHDVKLGFMGFFVKAAVEALRRFPSVNASIDGNDIIYHGYFDIGIAVGSPRGLVVPVLRDADAKSFAEVEKEIIEFGKKANEGKLTLEELTGGTFTISNGGVFGSMLSTPIINPPQTGILGMHSTQDRAVVENGEVVVRPMMYLALSYDHRLIDGREAVQFLVTIKQYIEDPSRLLFQI